MANMETDGRKLLQYKQIFKAFSEKIAYLICPKHPTFNLQDNVPGTKVYQSLKEILKSLAYLGRKETPVPATIIITKSFKLKHDRALIKEQFSQWGEEKYIYVSQWKRNMGKAKCTLSQKT